jgi:hypothetical protein
MVLPAVSARPATQTSPVSPGRVTCGSARNERFANRLSAPARRFFPWLMRSSRKHGPRRSTIRCPLTECDLDAYAVLADEFSAGSVPDTGCGTGNPRLPACRTWLGGQLPARPPPPWASPGASPGRAWRRPRPLVASRCQRSTPTAGPSRDHNGERGLGLRDRRGAGRQRCGQSMRPCDRRVCWCSRAGIPRRRRSWSRTGTRPATAPSSRTPAPPRRAQT